APQPRDTWLEDAVEAWRHEHRGCPGDATLVAYFHGECSWQQQLALWWHVRRCALCRADLATLDEAFAEGATDAAASTPHVQPHRVAFNINMGTLGVGLCLSLVLNVGLGYYAWHRMQAVTRLGHALTAAQAQVRAVQAEQQAWQTREAALTDQLATLQA